jgi:hypothetical protein
MNARIASSKAWCWLEQHIKKILCATGKFKCGIRKNVCCKTKLLLANRSFVCLIQKIPLNNKVLLV